MKYKIQGTRFFFFHRIQLLNSDLFSVSFKCDQCYKHTLIRFKSLIPRNIFYLFFFQTATCRLKVQKNNNNGNKY